MGLHHVTGVEIPDFLRGGFITEIFGVAVSASYFHPRRNVDTFIRDYASQLQKRAKRRLESMELCPLIERCPQQLTFQRPLVSCINAFCSALIAKLQLVPFVSWQHKATLVCHSWCVVAFLSLPRPRKNCSSFRFWETISILE